MKRACDDTYIHKETPDPCAGCTTRTTCLTIVQPDRIGYTGIAGGFKWHRGGIIATSIGRNARILDEYHALTIGTMYDEPAGTMYDDSGVTPEEALIRAAQTHPTTFQETDTPLP